MIDIDRRTFLTTAGAAAVCALIPPVRSGKNRGMIALTGGLLIDGTGAPPVQNANVLISGRQIVDAGGAQQVAIPLDAERIPVPGCSIIPGLINCNVHLTLDGTYVESADWWTIYQQEGPAIVARNLRAQLHAGVTTVRDTVDIRSAALYARRAVEGGRLLGPQVILGGPVAASAERISVLTGRNISHAEGALVREIIVPVRSAKTIRQDLSAYPEGECQYAKIGISGSTIDSHTAFEPELLRAVVEEIHRRGMYADCHVHGEEGVRAGIEARVDIMQHPEMCPTPLPQEVVETLARRAIYVCPLLNCLGAFIEALEDPDSLTDARHQQRLFPSQFERVKKIAQRIRLWNPAAPSTGLPSPLWKPYSLAQWRQFLSIAEDNVRRMHASGVPLIMGTDVGSNLEFHEFRTHVQEMKRYLALGIPPMEVIRTATEVAAKAIGRPNLGTIRRGNTADIVVVKGNPLADLDALENPRFIIKGGRLLPQA